MVREGAASARNYLPGFREQEFNAGRVSKQGRHEAQRCQPEIVEVLVSWTEECTSCGEPIVTQESEYGVWSEYRDKQGRCFKCAKKSRADAKKVSTSS